MARKAFWGDGGGYIYDIQNFRILGGLVVVVVVVHCGCQSKTSYAIRHKQGENVFHHLIMRWSFTPHLQQKCSVK